MQGCATPDVNLKTRPYSEISHGIWSVRKEDRKRNIQSITISPLRFENLIKPRLFKQVCFYKKKVLRFKNVIYLPFQILVWNFCINKRVPFLQRKFVQVQVIRVPESKLKKMKACTVGLATTPTLKSYPCHDTATIGVLIVIKRYQPVAHITIFCSKLFLSWKKSFVSHLSSSSFATFFPWLFASLQKFGISWQNLLSPIKCRFT